MDFPVICSWPLDSDDEKSTHTDMSILKEVLQKQNPAQWLTQINENYCHLKCGRARATAIVAAATTVHCIIAADRGNEWKWQASDIVIHYSFSASFDFLLLGFDVLGKCQFSKISLGCLHSSTMNSPVPEPLVSCLVIVNYFKAH